ncbi:MAG: hypothetical protein ACTS5G_01835, partial [Burkholderiales bacterium]
SQSYRSGAMFLPWFAAMPDGEFSRLSSYSKLNAKEDPRESRWSPIADSGIRVRDDGIIYRCR